MSSLLDGHIVAVDLGTLELEMPLKEYVQWRGFSLEEERYLAHELWQMGHSQVQVADAVDNVRLKHQSPY